MVVPSMTKLCVTWITRRVGPRRRPLSSGAGSAPGVRACEGPRGAEPRGPSFRQHRRQGCAGAWERRRGVAPLASNALPPPPVAGSGGCARRPVTSGGPAVVRRRRAMQLSAGGLGLVRIVLDVHRLRNLSTRTRVISAGRPRASPEPTVLLGDRAAVPCRPVTCPERGPTTHGTIRTSHRSGEPRVVLSGPPLAGTDTGSNEAAGAAVTRRTGENHAYVCAGNVRSCPGTAPAASSPGWCPAGPGRPGSGRGSPSRGTGSRAARRRRSVPAG